MPCFDSEALVGPGRAAASMTDLFPFSLAFSPSLWAPPGIVLGNSACDLDSACNSNLACNVNSDVYGDALRSASTWRRTSLNLDRVEVSALLCDLQTKFHILPSQWSRQPQRARH